MKIDIKERFGNLMKRAREMNLKELKTWKNYLFFAICVDIFGVYWFLHLRKLGIALLIIFLLILGFIMYLENQLPRESKKLYPKKPKDEPPYDFTVDLGLGSPEEYNKRLARAIS